MNIILNERKYVEQLLASGDIDSNNIYSDLTRVAKYYFAQGYKRAAVLKKVEELLKIWRPELYEGYEHRLGRIISRASRHKLMEIDSIPVYKPEFDIIKELPTMAQQRLAFTLLCLARMADIARGETRGWINTRDSRLFILSNVSGSRIERGVMLNDLKAAGLVRFPKAVNSINIEVLFAKNNGEVEMNIAIMRDLGYQYSHHVGKGKFIPCTVCGLPTPVRGGKQLGVYCSEHEPHRARNRVVECPDCGKTIVTPLSAKTDRCPRCYEIYRREAVRTGVARHRANRSM